MGPFIVAMASQVYVAATPLELLPPPEQPPCLVKTVGPEFPDALANGKTGGTVLLDVLVDETGGVQLVVVKSSDQFVEAAALAAVKQWKYTPGRTHGVAVEGVTKVTVNFNPSFGGPDVMPKVTHKEDAEYPDSMAYSANRGEVLLDYFVDKTGRVTDVSVVQSSHHEFEASGGRRIVEMDIYARPDKGGAYCHADSGPNVFSS